MSRPSAEVPKCSLGNMFLQCCNSLTCLLPFPFPSSSHGCNLLRNRVAARREMSFSSHNLHNWSSWKVTQHFCLLPHLIEVATDATKIPVPCRVILRRGCSLRKYSPLYLNSFTSHSDNIPDFPIKETGLSQIILPMGI